MNPKNTNNIEVGLYYDKFGHYQFNPLRTEAGGEGGGRGPMHPMHPRRDSFVDYFFSSMFKKIRPPCKFFFID